MNIGSNIRLEKQIRPVHPCEVIADLLEDLEMTTIDFAKKLDVSAKTVEAIIQGRLPLTVDMAIRLGKASITESFCEFHEGELFVINSTIEEYLYGTHYNHKTKSERKLLLNFILTSFLKRKQIYYLKN